ncbi:MAG: hypothetical protein RLZZ381_676 [Cyanobacteriota bacterium]|jgi:hypothetical protein
MLKPETFCSNQQFINAWNYFASACPQGGIVEADKLAIAWNDPGNVFFNTIFLTQPIQDKAELEAKIKMACD